MRIKSGVFSICIIGLIVIAFTLAAFFLLDIDKVPVNIWALIFLLVSEIALFGGLAGLRLVNENHSLVFLRAGVTTALSLYCAATFIIVFFTGAFYNKLNSFILIELAVVALFSIITVSIVTWSRSIARRNEADIAKVGSNEPKRGGF